MFRKMNGTDILVFIGSFAIGDTVVSFAIDYGINVSRVFWGTFLGACILGYYYARLRGK